LLSASGGNKRIGSCRFAAPVVVPIRLWRTTANRFLLSQKVAIEPKKSWQILYNLPAEARSAEAINSQHTIWLRTLNEIRTFFSENPNAEF
jgi:hypothetical protein